MIPINVNLPLKKITERIQSTRAVIWALETYGDPLREKLEQVFGPLLEEGQVAPFETQLELFKKKLITGSDEMVASDRAYRDQRALETKFRSLRDAEFSAVNSKVVVLRQAFSGIYSDEKLAEMGFARRTPQQPGELLEQATHLAVRLSAPNFDLDEAQVEGFQVDVPEAARELGPATERFRLSVDNLTREARRTEAAMLTKNDALEEYNRTFLYIARTVESLLRLTGYDEVARRVRPSARQPGVTARVNAEGLQGRSGDEASEGVEPAGDTPPAAPAEAPSSPESQTS